MMPQNSSPTGDDFELEHFGESDGRCDCCGTRTKRVWGFVRRIGEPIGAYFVSWTEGKPDHGAAFDLILGKWGDDATRNDRFSVALDYRLVDNIPTWMVVDAVNRVTSKSTLVGAAFKRTDVIGTPLAPQVFAIVDAVYVSTGIEELRTWREHEGTPE
jgi:hypothetical protein